MSAPRSTYWTDPATGIAYDSATMAPLSVAGADSERERTVAGDALTLEDALSFSAALGISPEEPARATAPVVAEVAGDTAVSAPAPALEEIDPTTVPILALLLDYLCGASESADHKVAELDLGSLTHLSEVVVLADASAVAEMTASFAGALLRNLLLDHDNTGVVVAGLRDKHAAAVLSDFALMHDVGDRLHFA